MSCLAWSAAVLPRASSPLRRSAAFSLRRSIRAGSAAAAVPPLVLHDSLDEAGIDTKLARAAREEFQRQIQGVTGIGGEASIVVRAAANLAKAALEIAAEDDSLVSHSSVPLPVDAFVERLDNLSMEYCTLYMPPLDSPPELFISNLERFFYVHKRFRRTDATLDARSLYLHSALTCRSGSAVILSLIYSEMLKMLKVYGLLDFDVEIFFPHDGSSLPRGYRKQRSTQSDEPHIMTSKSLLVKTLRDLKAAFWPFQSDHSTSLFLRAAHAANLSFASPTAGGRSDSHRNLSSGLEIASAKAAQHRLDRGVWTIARFGDMRRALAACERLVLLDCGHRELRDYAALLYHCGFYEECLQFLNLYRHQVTPFQDSGRPSKSRPDRVSNMEDELTENLMTRVKLILGEDGGRSKSKIGAKYWGGNKEPW